MEWQYITEEELAAQADTLIDAVHQHGTHYIITRDGKPLGALVPLGILARHRQQRQAPDTYETRKS